MIFHLLRHYLDQYNLFMCYLGDLQEYYYLYYWMNYIHIHSSQYQFLPNFLQ